MKRKISLLIVVSLVFLLPIYANVQIPVDSVFVDNVFYVLGEDIITGDSVINPTLDVGWENPQQWADAIDPADVHTPDFYEINVKNLTLGTENTIRVNEGSDSFDDQQVPIHESLNLDTGSLYETEVVPYHFHDNEDGSQELALQSGLPESAYAITDLQVKFQSDENSITVEWDNLGVEEFQYQIVYAIGDYSTQTKQDLIDNQEGQITGLTVDSQEVESYYDTVSQRNKLSYTIDENIFPGQVYSVMVEPTVEFYQGKGVTRNRNYPVINTVSTSIQLTYAEEGDYLRLQWSVPASFRVGQDRDQYALVESRLMQYSDGQGKNIAIFNGEAGTIGYYIVKKPLVETEYQLFLEYKAVDDESKPAITPESNRLVYSPTQVAVKPTKPVVPDLLTATELEELRDTHTTEEVRDILADIYLVPGSTYLGNFDALFDQGITYHVDSEDNAVNLAWGAFRRIDIDPTSATYNEMMTDLATYYDVWITNNYNALPYAERVLADQRYGSTDEDLLIKTESGTIVGFHTKLSAYYNDESGQLESLRPNQIYYLQVVAKKKLGDGEIKSEPTIMTFYYSDEGDEYAPPLITKPPLRVKGDETTSTNVSIAWREEWMEVTDPAANEGDALDAWLREVWMEDDGSLSDQATSQATYYPIYLGQDVVDQLQTDLDNLGTGIHLETRTIDLGKDPFGISDVKYRFRKVPYEEVQRAIETKQGVDPDYSFINYFDDMIQGDKDGSYPLNWDEIDPSSNPEDAQEMVYAQNGLLPNTSYLFILYPYRELYNGQRLDAHFPTPIVVATAPEIEEVNPDPKVPNLYITKKDPMSLTVTWKYNTDFTYEIVYGLEDDPSQAESIDLGIPEATTDPNYPDNGQYYDLVVDDLFPVTGYYFYIRATNPESNTTSAWSNPSFGVTDDIPAPRPPKGIGIASQSTMEDYGYEEAVTDEYLTIQWLKDAADVETDQDDLKVTQAYSYIIELADNPSFVDPIYVVSGQDDSVTPGNVELLEKTVLKVNELVANRPYYARLKTRVTVVGSEEGQVLIKESDSFSLPIRIITVQSGDEYDSNRDPALEILPEDNYELIYDPDQMELIYRFRSDEIDQDGFSDNRVDQRLITQLIEDNIYQYSVDVSGFENKPVTKRRVEIPFTLLEAFDTYQVSLAIDGGHLQLDLPMDAVMPVVSDMADAYNETPSMVIQIEDFDAFYDKSRLPQDALTSVSTPQEVRLDVLSDSANKRVRTLQVPMTVAVTTDNRWSIYNKEPLTYQHANHRQWETREADFNNYAGSFEFETTDIGAYGTFITEGGQELVKAEAKAHWSDPYKARLDDHLIIQGMDTYDPDGQVSQAVFYQFIDALIQDEANVSLDQALSSSDKRALVYGQVMPEESQRLTGMIQRLDALQAAVRSKELDQGATYPITDARVNPWVSKAYDAGLITDKTNVRANDFLTYGELFTLLTRVKGW